MCLSSCLMFSPCMSTCLSPTMSLCYSARCLLKKCMFCLLVFKFVSVSTVLSCLCLRCSCRQVNGGIILLLFLNGCFWPVCVLCSAYFNHGRTGETYVQVSIPGLDVRNGWVYRLKKKKKQVQSTVSSVTEAEYRFYSNYFQLMAKTSPAC